MARISFQLRVEQDADDVFAFIAQPERRAECEAGVVEARKLTDGPVAPGTQLHVVRRTPLGRAVLTTEVAALDPDERVIEERVVAGPLRGSTAQWRVVQTGWGAKVAIAYDMRCEGRFALLAPLVERRLRRDLERTCRNLRETLRSGS